VVRQDFSARRPEHPPEDEHGNDGVVERPAIGMNSGMRSMGDANQATPNRRRSFELRGTRGSLRSPRNSQMRLGRKAAISRAAVRRPARRRMATSTSQRATTIPRTRSRVLIASAERLPAPQLPRLEDDSPDRFEERLYRGNQLGSSNSAATIFSTFSGDKVAWQAVSLV
jgi:hypothetical protein